MKQFFTSIFSFFIKSKKGRFCCERFGLGYTTPNSFGMNIRVVKPGNAFAQRAKSHNMPLDRFAFYITAGYKDDITESTAIVIKHCPYCGMRLKDFYTDHSYVQEILDVPVKPANGL